MKGEEDDDDERESLIFEGSKVISCKRIGATFTEKRCHLQQQQLYVRPWLETI